MIRKCVFSGSEDATAAALVASDIRSGVGASAEAAFRLLRTSGPLAWVATVFDLVAGGRKATAAEVLVGRVVASALISPPPPLQRPRAHLLLIGLFRFSPLIPEQGGRGDSVDIG